MSGAEELREELRADAKTYTSCYCEENVLRLMAHPAIQAFLAVSPPQWHVIIITNSTSSVAVLEQRAGSEEEGGLVVWDYHVVLATPQHVFDLDSRLPFPCPTEAYISNSFPRPPGSPWSPCFRLLTLEEYSAHFASDRRHMRKDGAWLSPPPAWEAFKGASAGDAHTLGLLLDLSLCAPGAVLHSPQELLEVLQQRAGGGSSGEGPSPSVAAAPK